MMMSIKGNNDCRLALH